MMSAHTHGHDVYVQAWLHLCAHIRVGMIQSMCAYTRGHDRAYVCIYVSAWSRSCVHTHADLNEPRCACTHGHDQSYLWICAWAMHIRVAFVRIYACAWLLLCVHVCVGMIAPMCAYTRGHDGDYVCMFAWAWSHLWMHPGIGMIKPLRVSKIAPMITYTRRDLCTFIWIYTGRSLSLCAYTRGHDCISVCI